MQQVERKQRTGRTGRPEARGEDRLERKRREHRGGGGTGRNAAIDEVFSHARHVERWGRPRTGSARQQRCEQGVERVTAKQARDRRQEGWRHDRTEQCSRRQDCGARPLQHREGAKVLTEAQHGQVQVAAALRHGNEAADQRHQRRHTEGERDGRSGKAEKRAGCRLGNDRSPLRRFAFRRLAGIEAHAGETHPFESGDRTELAERDEERIGGIVDRGQPVGDDDQEAESDQGLIEIGAERDDLRHGFPA
ncbi:hypothetical protein D3C87_1484250 [compost metagenome]